jgi:hypothetical protein
VVVDMRSRIAELEVDVHLVGYGNLGPGRKTCCGNWWRSRGGRVCRIGLGRTQWCLGVGSRGGLRWRWAMVERGGEVGCC